MFILIRSAGRSITVASNPTEKECAQADAIVLVGKDGVAVIKNRGHVGEVGDMSAVAFHSIFRPLWKDVEEEK